MGHLVYQTSAWQFDWHGGAGTLSLGVYVGSSGNPSCESDWTLTVR